MSDGPDHPGGLYHPPADGDWERIAPGDAGFTQSGIDDLIAIARGNRSTTLTVLAGGRIVAEEYFGDADASTAADVASVQKSVISTLVGIARDKGLLELDDPVSAYLSPGWSGGAEHESTITIRHAMTHSSGLHPRTLQSVAEPGAVYDYNTAVYQRLRPLLEQAAGEDINTVTHGWMFDSIGPAGATTWQQRSDPDDPSNVGDAWGLFMTAREMARFGLLSLRRGQWDGIPVVSNIWYDEAWAPSDVKRDYGLLWWLMGQGRVRGPGVPNDWVAALGARDQKIYVFPSFDVVLTRQGLAANEETESVSNFDKVLLNALIAARA